MYFLKFILSQLPGAVLGFLLAYAVQMTEYFQCDQCDSECALSAEAAQFEQKLGHEINYSPSMKRTIEMLNWALTFLVAAMIAAIIGFGVDGPPAIIAKTFFVIFLILFMAALIKGKPWNP